MGIKKSIGRRLGARIILLALCVLAAFASTAQALEVRREVLPNGLVLLHAERHNLPIVMVSLAIKASPIDEPAQKAGLASLTASLLDEGTTARTSAEISSGIEFIGASIGASAGEDLTTVSLSVLKKDLDRGFEIFSDIVLNPVFRQEEIDRVKKLVKDSLRQSEEDPSFVAGKAFRKALYGDHPYGRLVQGTPETLDNITRDDLVRFHRDYYVPGNAILAVVGDITEAELKALLEKYFKDWQARPAPKRDESRLELQKRQKREAVLLDKKVTQASILLGSPGIRRDNPDYYAVSVMNYILGGGGFASRLMGQIRDRLGLAYDVHSFFTTNRYTGMFQVGVQTKNESAKTVIEAILSELDRMRSSKVSDEELSGAKSFLTGSFPRRLDTMRKIADFLTAVEFYGLGLDYIDKYPQYINRVTAEDVLRVAGKYLDRENYLLVVVGNLAETGLEAR